MWLWLHLYFCILLVPLLFYLNILRKCLMGITNLEWILTELISIPKCVSIKVSPNFDNFTLPVWQTINSSLTCITFLFLRCIYLFYLLCTQCSSMYAFMTEKNTKSHYRSLWTSMLVAGHWTQNLWKPLSIHHVFSVPHFILNFIYNTFQKTLMGWGWRPALINTLLSLSGMHLHPSLYLAIHCCEHGPHLHYSSPEGFVHSFIILPVLHILQRI